MPLNLTHCTFKHSQTPEMALYISKNWSTASIYPFLKCWLNLKTVSYGMWNPSKKASNQNLASEGVLPAVGEPEERLLSADTSVEGKRAGRGVLSKQGSTPDVFDVHKAPGERNISLLSAVYFSALLRQATPSRTKHRDKEDSVKERRGTPHLSCRHFSYSKVLPVFPLHQPEFTFMWRWKWLIPRRLP